MGVRVHVADQPQAPDDGSRRRQYDGAGRSARPGAALAEGALRRQGPDPGAGRSAARIRGPKRHRQRGLGELLQARRRTPEARHQKGHGAVFQTINATIGTMAVGLVTPDDIVNKTGLTDYWPRPSGEHMLMVLRGTFEWAKAKCKLPFNPADRAYVTPLLSKKKHAPTPHKSMPFEEVPQFLLELRRYQDRSPRRTGRLPIALALEFVVWTCVRGNEVCSATWKEIDLANRLWNVPPENRKTGALTNKVRAI